MRPTPPQHHHHHHHHPHNKTKFFMLPRGVKIFQNNKLKEREHSNKLDPSQRSLWNNQECSITKFVTYILNPTTTSLLPFILFWYCSPCLKASLHIVEPFKDMTTIPAVAVIRNLTSVQFFIRLIKNDFPVPGDP